MTCPKHPTAPIRRALEVHPFESVPLGAYVADGSICTQCEKELSEPKKYWPKRYWAGTNIPRPEGSTGINMAAWLAMLTDKSLDTHAHLPFLYDVAHGNVLEIGVHCGISTTALLAGLECHGGHLWSIDTHPSCRYVHYGHPQWTFYCTWAGDKPQPDLPLDVLFIDGDHSCLAVTQDLLTWGPKVREGGLILLHDADSASFPGVRSAITGYCDSNNLRHELRTGSNGLEVIYR